MKPISYTLLLLILLSACQSPIIPGEGINNTDNNRLPGKPDQISHSYNNGIFTYEFDVRKHTGCDRLSKDEMVLNTENPQVIVTLSTIPAAGKCNITNRTEIVAGNISIPTQPGGMIVTFDGSSLYASQFK